VAKYRNVLRMMALAAGVGAAVVVASAQEGSTYVLTLEGDAFTPAELKVPAGQPFVLRLVNKENSAAEFEAKELKVEKIVAAGADAIARVKAMQPGRYLLVNEFKEDTVKTFVVVE